MARDLLLTYAHNVEIARATQDVDLAFAVSDWEIYYHLRQSLIDTGDFKAVPVPLHRLIFRAWLPVDLIPFGHVERPDRTIAWPPGQEEVMTVLGYSEAIAAAIEVQLPGNEQIAVISLPGLAILKIFAWHERHYRAPHKDAYDLWLLLWHYLDAGNDERIHSEASHLLEREDFDVDRAGAWLLGADARRVLEHGEAPDVCLNQLHSILESEIEPDGRLRLVSEMRETDAEAALGLLVAFHSGLMGKEEP
jgi:predicted nucleotidyltransferase